MRYSGEEALGLVETIGLTPALEAADKMLKAADVELISYENVGSTLVTIMVKGDVAAVRSSVEAGAAAAAAIGKLTAKNVMPRPIQGVGDIVSVHDVDAKKQKIGRKEESIWKDMKPLVPLKHLAWYLFWKPRMRCARRPMWN